MMLDLLAHAAAGMQHPGKSGSPCTLPPILPVIYGNPSQRRARLG